ETALAPGAGRGGCLFDIPLILLFEGLTNGAIYALMALGLVVLYAVTGVINVAIGEFVMISALTVASLRAGAVPGTVYLLVAGLASGAPPSASPGRWPPPRPPPCSWRSPAAPSSPISRTSPWPWR